MASIQSRVACLALTLSFAVAQPARVRPGLYEGQPQAGMSLLQVAASSSAGAKAKQVIPSDFFEDAPAASHGASLLETSQFDVGAGAVPTPNVLESPTAFGTSGAADSKPALSLAGVSAGADLSQQIEDVLKRQASGPTAEAPARTEAAAAPAARQIDGQLPPGADSNPLLLDQADGAALTEHQQQLQQLLQQAQALQEQQRQAELQKQREEQQRAEQQRQQAAQQAQQAQQAAQQAQRAAQQAQQQAHQQQKPQPSLAELEAQLQLRLQQLHQLEAKQRRPAAGAAGAAAGAAQSSSVAGAALSQQVASRAAESADFEDHPRAAASRDSQAANVQSLAQQLKDALVSQAQQRQSLQNQQLEQARLAAEADSREQLARQEQRQAVDERQALELQARLQRLHEEQQSLYALEQSISSDLAGKQATTARRAPQQTFLYRQAAEQQAQRQAQATMQAAMHVAPGGAMSFAGVQAQEFAPDHEQCTPKCNYQCTNPTCDQVCEAVCDSPKCETRCGGSDLSACFMQCGKPHCAVVCPKTPCVGSNCPSCRTQCSDPMCMLQCPKAQPCHNVCEHPKCTWKCRAPDSCPKPVCNMTCDTPSICVGSTFQQLPPLNRGEMLVQSFVAPSVRSLEELSQPLADGGLSQADLRQDQGTMQVPVYVGADGASSSQESTEPQQMMVQMPIVTLPNP